MINYARNIVSKYTVDGQYFKTIDSGDKAYWLGVLVADGSIWKKGGSRFISLCVSDRCDAWLELYRKDLRCTFPLSRHCGNAQVKIYSHVGMFNDLVRLGMTPRKSLNEVYPPIAPMWDSDFIRGYFDGDGCVTRYGKSNRVSFHGGFGIVSSIRNILIRRLCLSEVSVRTSGRTFLVSWGGNYADKIRDFMYKDDFQVRCLESKRRRFLWI